jgi:tripartite-type tricarboxylate transporter receptor subunit TctC
MRLVRCVWILVISFTMAAANLAAAQNYPNKFVRIVTSAPGSNDDWGARIVAQELTRTLGQPVIVENRGAIAVEFAAKAAPDGYTLLFYGNPVWVLPLIRVNAPWDALRDFIPVSMVTRAPIVIVVHPSLPVKSVRELIALARARPGELNYAAGTIGASPHLATELFKSMTGVDFVRVAYKGTGPSVVALVGGQVHLMFSGLGSVAAHIKSGRLRALAVASLEPSPLVPDLPTVDSAGVPGFQAYSMIGMFAPAKTPTAIVNLLHQEIARGLLNKPEVKDVLFTAGAELVVNTPEEFSAVIKADITRLTKLIKEANIRE